MKKTNYYEICEQKLNYLNYSNNSTKIYLHYINEFLTIVNVYPTRLRSDDFQNYINNYSFSSISQQNQIISSINLPI